MAAEPPTPGTAPSTGPLGQHVLESNAGYDERSLVLLTPEQALAEWQRLAESWVCALAVSFPVAEERFLYMAALVGARAIIDDLKRDAAGFVEEHRSVDPAPA